MDEFSFISEMPLSRHNHKLLSLSQYIPKTVLFCNTFELLSVQRFFPSFEIAVTPFRIVPIKIKLSFEMIALFTSAFLSSSSASVSKRTMFLPLNKNNPSDLVTSKAFFES